MSIDSARYARQSDSDFNAQFSRRWTEPPFVRRLSHEEAEETKRMHLHAAIEARLRLALQAEAAQ